MSDRTRPVAHGHEPPGLGLGTPGEPERREGNGHLHHIAGGGDARPGFPDRIPAPVLVAVHVGIGGIHLNAERIDPELKPTALVVKGIQEEADGVVLERKIAIVEMSADLPGLGILGVERDVDVAIIEGHVGHSLHRRPDVVAGLPFVLDGQPDRFLPDRVVQDAVDLRGRGRSGDRSGLLLPRRRRRSGFILLNTQQDERQQEG